MRILVAVKTQFEGIHYWPECDIPEVMYLKQPHRHMFYVTVKLDVTRADREIEFIHAKHLIDTYIRTNFVGETLTLSCEQIALDLMKRFGAAFVSVYEDNENGAEVYED